MQSPIKNSIFTDMPMTKTIGVSTGAIRIFNIDATKTIPDSIFFEVEKILSGGDMVLDLNWWNTLSPKMKLSCKNYFNIVYDSLIPFDYDSQTIQDINDIRALMVFFVRTIPIVTKKSEESTYPLFGRYFSYRDDPFYCYRPHIEIYSDRIWERCKIERDFSRHCVMTILHELSHALMDPLNYGANNLFRDTYESDNAYEYNFQGKTVNFYKMREESLAETMMYKVITAAQKSIINKYEYNSKDKTGCRFLSDSFTGKDVEYAIAPLWFNEKVNFSGWIRAKASVKIPPETAQKWLSAIDNAVSMANGHITIKPNSRFKEDPSLPGIKEA